MTDLGTLGSSDTSAATGITKDGLVVGTNVSQGGSPSYSVGLAGVSLHSLLSVPLPRALGHGEAVARAPGSGIVKLIDRADAPGWQVNAATGINDAGQVVGSAVTPDSLLHGFILKPP